MSRRLVLVLAFAGLWMAAIAGRLAALQVVDHDRYLAKAAGQQQRVIDLPPSRGTIFDARGRELAVSVEVESAWADPSEVPDPAALAAAVARAVGADAGKIRDDLTRPGLARLGPVVDELDVGGDGVAGPFDDDRAHGGE